MKITELLPRAKCWCAVLGLVLFSGVTMAQVATAPDINALKKGGTPTTQLTAKAVGDPDRFRHEIWGQSNYGDGYIYGPTNRRSGMTVVDIDLDGDNDFVFPSSISSPQLMQNLGSSNAFFPGGSVTLQTDTLPADTTWDLNMDFADLTGDGLPDLVAVVNFEQEFGTFTKKVAFYRNEGPRTNPTFSFQRILASSQQESANQRAMWVALADINGDGLQDLFIAESWIFSAEPHHRVYQGLNVGTASDPSFPEYVEITELSNLLPDRITFDKKENADATGAELPIEQGKSAKAKGTTYSYNLGDIALHDWDFDGLLDFMFYDRSLGLTLVRNIGTTTEPSWNNTLGTETVTYIYEHSEIDELTYAEGTFAIRENPDAELPGVDWLRDIYVSVNSRLKNYRFFTGEGEGYRNNQQNAVAFPAGQGAVAFWDFDSDGDLDMFRTGVSPTSTTNLILLKNEGAPYAPAWGEFASGFSLTSVPLNSGDADNDYRNDLFLFDDHDADGAASFFVQQLDGNIAYYRVAPSTSSATPPTFTLLDNTFVDAVDASHSVTTPRGFAMTDFDLSNDGKSELIVAYSYVGDTALRVIDTGFGQIYDLNEGTLPANFLPDPKNNAISIDPLYIESMTSGDLDLDGRPDLVVAWSADPNFENTELHYYLNVLEPNHNNFSIPAFRFVYGGSLDFPYNTDHRFGRMPHLTDIDSDGDNDLYVGHRYPDNHGTNLRSYLRFYRNIVDSGIDIYRERLVANQSIDLSIGNLSPDYVQISNNSGGTLQQNSIYQAGATAPAIDVVQSVGLERNARVFLDVLPTVGANDSKAIIVVGDTADDSLYPTFSVLADFAYFVLRSEGLPAENIRFYADDASGLDGAVAGKPTLASLEDSITNWGQNSERLLVYLVDHGQRDRFRMNATEYLEADDLDAWYDELQNVNIAERTQITTLIDTCEAGSFIDNLALSKAQKADETKGTAGPQRITMTSAGQGPIEGVALFDQEQLISFSLNFWFNIYNGRDYGQAFDEAKVSIEAVNPLQVAQIDGDGNGVANQGGDSALATGQRPGANFDIQVPGVFIGDVSADQVISTNATQLSMGGIVSPFPVEGAGALIVPPNFQRPSLGNDDEQPISGLDFIDFTYNSETERWSGTYNGFTNGGLYQVQYFVRSGGQFHASPRIGFVDRIGVADAWENDDTPENANWIPINSVQGHNFHDNADADWVRFSPLPNQKATIAIVNAGPNNRAVVEIFKSQDILDNGLENATPLRTEISEDFGEDLVFEQNFTTSEQYAMRVTNQDPTVSGAGTSYLLLVAVGTGGSDLIPTTLIVRVMESDGTTPVADADVMFDGRNVGKSSSQGICHMSVSAYATYQIQASKSGFVTSARGVTVNNIIEEAMITMASEGGGSETLARIAESLLNQFAAADGDSNGTLDFSEASAAYAALTQTQFDDLDTDNDSALSNAELQAEVDDDEEETRTAIARDLKESYDTFDLDEDGVLSFEEAAAATDGMTRARFDAMDGNDDGFLSEEELQTQIDGNEPPMMSCAAGKMAFPGGLSGDLLVILLFSIVLLFWRADGLLVPVKARRR